MSLLCRVKKGLKKECPSRKRERDAMKVGHDIDEGKVIKYVSTIVYGYYY
jgi:hypothetical protein